MELSYFKTAIIGRINRFDPAELKGGFTLRHAFLVLAHHQFDILMKTLKILDDANVDFYIHIDQKAGDFPREAIENSCKKSHIAFIDRIPVYWGGYNSILCTVMLLEEAIKGKYDYNHLISGVDLPIKPKEYILDFFEKSPKRQFIHFESETLQDKYLERIKYHRPFQERSTLFHKAVNGGVRMIEQALHVDRTKHNSVSAFQFGGTWFSMTHELAQYVVSRKEWIRKTFSYSYCGDELVIQTLVFNSPFKEELTDIAFKNDYMSCLRYVDWKRGTPYVFRNEDYDDLIGSPYLFARKFDLNVDAKIVERIYEYCIAQ